jgi:hypothetical protein
MNDERSWANGGSAKPYSVTLWDTHPELNEDTCSTGTDFATLEEAQACFHNLELGFNMSLGYWNHTPYVLLDGPGIHEVRKREGIKPCKDDDSAERSEYAMQQGMGFGVDAYNEAMGWDE